jgi:hypothetical protein
MRNLDGFANHKFQGILITVVASIAPDVFHAVGRPVIVMVRELFTMAAIN